MYFWVCKIFLVENVSHSIFRPFTGVSICNENWNIQSTISLAFQTQLGFATEIRIILLFVIGKRSYEFFMSADL